MVDEYRIISNRVTSLDDSGSLSSYGQSRHPSSNFADNNYFFNVIYELERIREDKFDTNDSRITLRWPGGSYYRSYNGDDGRIAEAQRQTLAHRFPYKFFYMWTHETACIHLLSLFAYRGLVQSMATEISEKYDENQDIDFEKFKNTWQKFSDDICNVIPVDERGENFMDEISKLLSIVLIQDQQIVDIKELLDTGNRALVLYGPPGTGKTYLAKELVAKELGIAPNGDLEQYKFVDNKQINGGGAWAIVQFHPNYSYEDFIGGISPELKGEVLKYTLKQGIFKRLCDRAVTEPSKKFVMIVDEINRADLSAVFGELMYALEYRNEKINIPNFNEPFVIPSNVYLIGTMNSIDKSLVTFDLALRRRFAFYKVMPNLDVIPEILKDYSIKETVMSAFIERCKQLNRRIADPTSRLQLGVEYQIGQAYFGKIKDFLVADRSNDTNESEPVEHDIDPFAIEKLWEYHLKPLLTEYLGNRVDDDDIINCLEDVQRKFIEPLDVK